MKSWSVGNVFSVNHLRWLEMAQRHVSSFPEPAKDEPLLRCHEVARAIGRVLGLPVVDGKYGIVEHSWLLTLCPGERTVILDCYAVGSLPQVQLIDPTVPGVTPYLPGPARRDIHEATVTRLRDIAKPGGAPYCEMCEAVMTWCEQTGKAVGYYCPRCGW